MRQFLIALSFFTRIHIKLNNVSEDEFYRSMLWMPVVGVVIGLVLMGGAWLSAQLKVPSLAAVLLIILYIWISGGLHLDGFADTTDALFSARDRERMMEIMKDSRLGSFGAIGLILLVLTLWNGYTILIPLLPAAFLIMPVLGRYNALQSCAFSTYAEGGGGLGKRIVELTKPWYLLLHLLYLLPGAYLLTGLGGLAAVALTMVCGLLFMVYLKGKFGGITGDTIGMTIELSQGIYAALMTVGLMNAPGYFHV